MKTMTEKIDKFIINAYATKVRSIVFAILFPTIFNILISMALIILFGDSYKIYAVRLQIIANTILFIILIYVYIRSSKLIYNDIDNNFKVKNIVLILFLGFSISIFGNTLSNILMKEFNIVEENLTVKAILNANIVEALLLTCISAPLTEEIIFRGYIFKTINRYHGFIFSAVISSILFGISHIFPISILFAFLCGMFLSYVYYLYKSILMCMILHMMVNLSSLMVHYFLNMDQNRREIYFILFIAFVLIIMITLRLHIYCKNYTENNN